MQSAATHGSRDGVPGSSRRSLAVHEVPTCSTLGAAGRHVRGLMERAFDAFGRDAALARHGLEPLHPTHIGQATTVQGHRPVVNDHLRRALAVPATRAIEETR